MLHILAFSLFVIGNGVRGGEWSNVFARLPGHTAIYVAILYGLIAAFMFGWIPGLITAVGYFIAIIPGWGMWFDLNREDERNKLDKRWNTPYVKFFRTISGGNDLIAMMWRYGLFFIPFAIATWIYNDANTSHMVLWHGVFGGLSYQIGWWLHDINPKIPPIRTAEYLVGAIWFFIVYASFGGF